MTRTIRPFHSVFGFPHFFPTLPLLQFPLYFSLLTTSLFLQLLTTCEYKHENYIKKCNILKIFIVVLPTLPPTDSQLSEWLALFPRPSARSARVWGYLQSLIISTTPSSMIWTTSSTTVNASSQNRCKKSLTAKNWRGTLMGTCDVEDHPLWSSVTWKITIYRH